MHWLRTFQEWSGLDTHQMQWMAAAFAIITGISLWLGRSWGWAESRYLYKKGDDHGQHIIFERLIFIENDDGTVFFDRETDSGAFTLDEIVDSPDLCTLIRHAIKHSKDGRILPSGRDHRIMMSRFDAHITGNDQSASQSAMFGRHSEYHQDEVAFTLRNM